MKSAELNLEKQARANGVPRVTPYQHPAPIDAICGMAGDKKQDDARQELRESYVAERKGIFRDVIDLPPNGHRLHFKREDGEHARDLVTREIRIGEGNATGAQCA